MTRQRVEMTNAGNLIVREVDRVADLAALQALDTSFSSESIYEVKTVGDSLNLQLRPLPSPRCKRFTIDLDVPVRIAGFVAISDGELCGFIATNYEGWHRRLAIWHFYVDKNFRRRGIGRRLMQHALESGRKEGAETSNFNHPGVQTYHQLGFALCGFDLSLYKGTPSGGEFAVYLALSIQPATGCFPELAMALSESTSGSTHLSATDAPRTNLIGFGRHE